MVRITTVPDRVVRASAGSLTRRRLLRDAGGACFGAALAVGYFGAHAQVAQACDVSTVCGPSPLCGTARCSGYNCDTSRSDTKWQKHGAHVCGTQSDVNCWTSGCSSGGQIWRCCDCCGTGTNGCGELCSGCGANTWRSCICHAVLSAC
jgi:hypothetical protein